MNAPVNGANAPGGADLYRFSTSLLLIRDADCDANGSIAMNNASVGAKGRSALYKLVVASLIALLIWICFRHRIPSGVGGIRSAISYLFFAIDRGAVASPRGTSRVNVYSYDAGAAHSGWFWTEVIATRWWGREVVARGYLPTSRGNTSLKWENETTFSIPFRKQRYGDYEEVASVDLSK